MNSLRACAFLEVFAAGFILLIIAIPGKTQEPNSETEPAQSESVAEKKEETSDSELEGAIRRGAYDDVVKLLHKVENIDSRGRTGLTHFQLAAVLGYRDIARLLLEKGAEESKEWPSPESVVDRLAADLYPTVDKDGKRVSGATVLVSNGGEILFHDAYGYADVEKKIQMEEEMVFRIGSITKQFIAMAIVVLEEQKKLNFTNTIDQYFPDFPRAKEVTILHLLQHTSGIKSFTSQKNYLDRMVREMKPDDMVDWIKDESYDFNPGEGWKYNNTGYFLLGLVIEKVSGKPYGEFLKETFFDPLGMKNTGVYRNGVQLEHEAMGYSGAEGGEKRAVNWNMDWAGGAGALYSTVYDLYLWNEALYGGKLISEKNRERAFTPIGISVEEGQSVKASTSGYGYGLKIADYRGLRTIGHGGGLHGFHGSLMRYPEHDLTVVVLTNTWPASHAPPPTVIAQAAASSFLWKSMSPQKSFRKPKEGKAGNLADYVGRYNYGRTMLLRVVEMNGTLRAQLTHRRILELRPAGGDKFFWKDFDAKVMFLRDADHKVTKARYTQGRSTFEAPRLKGDPVHDPAKLGKVEDYLGEYEYEPGLLMKLTMKDGKILSTLTGQRTLELLPFKKDQFFWAVVDAQIEFLRDKESGKVTGAKHTQYGKSWDVKKTK